jgi:hypothetical protein
MPARGRPGPVGAHELASVLMPEGDLHARLVLEPQAYPALSTRSCLPRRTERALVRSGRTDVLAALGFGDALTTCTEGEWRIGHHLPDGDATPVVSSPPRG